MTQSAGLGGIREESALLVEAIRGLTGRAHTPGGAGAPSDGPQGQGTRRRGHADGSPCGACGCQAPLVCSGCPICRSAATLRSMAPSALEQMADLAVMVADSLRVAAHARRDGPSGTTFHHPTSPDEGAAP